MRIQNRTVKAAAIAALALWLAGCTASPADTGGGDAGAELPIPTSKAEAVAQTRDKLVEDRSVYLDDQEDSIVDFYITVTKDNLTAEPPMTWGELNAIHSKAENTEEKKVQVILQEGNAEGPENGLFGYSDTHANGDLTLRGNSTLAAAMKSYKIKLYDEAGQWRGQSTINFVKHAYDFTRIRNKLSFDYFKILPDFTSLRTQFVHLHVKDLTSGDTAFRDYGLYEQIEQPNKRFLKSHGLDSNAQLYKVTSFEFLRYEDELKEADDPEYDEAKFNSILEIKGSNDHEKLLAMLDDINDYSLNFDQVFDKYFDRDNFLTWLAVNILTDNIDTINQNYLLYSPVNSEKFFFLPWDYDGAWGYNEFNSEDDERAPWQRGISNYWSNTLENRFFKNPDNVQQLLDKVAELEKIFTPERTAQMIESYKKVVSPFVHRSPDLDIQRAPIELFDEELKRLETLPALNAQRFRESLENPMPFFLAEPETSGGETVFQWGASYDLQGDDIKYDFQVAKTPDFRNPISRQTGLQVTSVKLPQLEPGRYFYQVTVTDSKGNSNTAFDIYEDTEDVKYFGVVQFYVE